jgi:NifU-like protein involved in Fe-S cluster formation
MINDVYNAKILGFAGNIARIGRLDHPDATAKAHSKLCGSTVTVDLKMQDGVVTDFRP